MISEKMVFQTISTPYTLVLQLVLVLLQCSSDHALVVSVELINILILWNSDSLFCKCLLQ